MGWIVSLCTGVEGARHACISLQHGNRETSEVPSPLLKEAYERLQRDGAVGVDGETWEQYGEDLDSRLLDLQDRIQRGSYHPKPVRRVYIPKPGGGERPLGIPALEDKIVQSAARRLLEPIYEASEFMGFSYGFRPGRSQHDALDALHVALKRKVNWVLDADIRKFFDTIDHDWMKRFLEHRIADRRMVRLLMERRSKAPRNLRLSGVHPHRGAAAGEVVSNPAPHISKETASQARSFETGGAQAPPPTCPAAVSVAEQRAARPLQLLRSTWQLRCDGADEKARAVRMARAAPAKKPAGKVKHSGRNSMRSTRFHGHASLVAYLWTATHVLRRPKVGARCGKSARRDLSGGRPARAVPTGTRY